MKRSVCDEKKRLQDWADTLDKSAKKIAANTAHMVEIEVRRNHKRKPAPVAPQMASGHGPRHLGRAACPALAHGEANTHAEISA